MNFFGYYPESQDFSEFRLGNPGTRVCKRQEQWNSFEYSVINTNTAAMTVSIRVHQCNHCSLAEAFHTLKTGYNFIEFIMAGNYSTIANRHRADVNPPGPTRAAADDEPQLPW